MDASPVELVDGVTVLADAAVVATVDDEPDDDEPENKPANVSQKLDPLDPVDVLVEVEEVDADESEVPNKLSKKLPNDDALEPEEFPEPSDDDDDEDDDDDD